MLTSGNTTPGAAARLGVANQLGVDIGRSTASMVAEHHGENHEVAPHHDERAAPLVLGDVRFGSRLCENAKCYPRRFDAFEFRTRNRKVLNVRAPKSQRIERCFQSPSVFTRPRSVPTVYSDSNRRAPDITRLPHSANSSAEIMTQQAIETILRLAAKFPFQRK